MSNNPLIGYNAPNNELIKGSFKPVDAPSEEDFDISADTHYAACLRECGPDADVLYSGSYFSHTEKALRSIFNARTVYCETAVSNGIITADIPDGLFDCVILQDILQSAANPAEILDLFIPKLKDGAPLVVTIPNASHIDTVYNLIRGRFNYADGGPMSRENLRMYTGPSFMDMIHDYAEEKGLIINAKVIGRSARKCASEFQADIPRPLTASILQNLEKLYKQSGFEWDMLNSHLAFKLTVG